MASHQGSFFILKKTKYSESDLIVQALSNSGEKVSFWARGALKSKKRFAGGLLEPTHLVELHYQDSKKVGGLRLLTEAQMIESFDHLRTDYDRLTLALFAVDCVGRVSLEGDQGSAVVFQLLGHLFQAINEGADLQILKTQFITKFLFQQGVLTPEGWMTPYLKTSIHESANLTALKVENLESMRSLEKAAFNYIRTDDPS